MRKSGVLMLAIAAPALGQAPAASPPPCKGPEYRTLDFWVGDWVAYDTEGKRVGTNKITRDEYGDCVITEHFRMDDGSMIGHSVSTYRPGLKEWRQTWVDSQNGYFELAGGPVKASDHIFVLENRKLTPQQPELRMIFQDVKADSFTWRWQKRAGPDQPWADSWVINYRKATDASTTAAK